MKIQGVRNPSVWRQLKILFIGSALLFLINIYFGFDNALTAGDIPRSQSLIRLSIGARCSAKWPITATSSSNFIVAMYSAKPSSYQRGYFSGLN